MKQQGFSLITVLILMSLLLLIMMPMLLISYIRTVQGQRFTYSQKAYYGAEGAMFETLERIKQFPEWAKPGPIDDTYQLGDNRVSRRIVWEADPPEPTPPFFHIDILATNDQAQRRIMSDFFPEVSTTTQKDIDLMLVLDYSGSMANGPLGILKTASKNLLDTLSQSTANHRVGVVRFSNTVELRGLTEVSDNAGIQALKEFIDSPFVQQSTNTSKALRLAVDELQPSMPEKEKMMIVFSDGAPNLLQNWVPGPVSCTSIPCYIPNGSGNEPAQGDPLLFYGTSCSNEAIGIAKGGRAAQDADLTNDIKVYSIFLVNIPNVFPPVCGGNISLAEQFGRVVMFLISSEGDGPQARSFNSGQDYDYYKEADNASEIEAIFDDLGSQITTTGRVTFREIKPD